MHLVDFLKIAGFCLLTVVVFSTVVSADPPPGYYSTASGLSGESLRLALHEIVDDHQRIPYTSSATDTWDALGVCEQDPANPSRVITVYRNTSVLWSEQNTSIGWNREHTWPSSFGYTNDNGCNYPYSDLHQLRAASPSYNSARGNRPYDWCTSANCEGFVAEGTAFSNFASGFGSTGSWEAWEDRRGDVARNIFYMDMRYEGGTHSQTGCSEPDLRITDNRSLIVSNTSQNLSVAYMGLLSVLLEWHLEDPVSVAEQNRNDAVFGYQGNRNPFIDHPEFVCLIWACPTTDTTPPAVPSGLVVTEATCELILDWADNLEADLASYTILRSTTAAGPYSVIGSSTLSSFTDTTVDGGVTYHYQITASDLSGNQSNPSSNASGVALTGTGCGGPPPNPGDVDLVISELMPNPQLVSDATGEWLEIFNRGTLSVDLSGWTIRDDDTDSHLISAVGGLVIPPLGFVVLARSADPASNGGVNPDYVYSSFILANSVDEIVLIDPQGVEHTRVNYTSGTFPYGAGVSCELLDLSATLPGDSVNWAASQQPFGVGDLGSPGNEGGATLPPPTTNNDFVRGDPNSDGTTDISDPIMVLEFLFGSVSSLSCPDSGDANDDGAVDISDAIFLLQYLFEGSVVIPDPVGTPGPDPTPDALGC
ncbi:MAG: hypothetical protein CBC13_03020 [Planctomycetia bacterium TMED53]|nr:MAG: hypothetical protein CBC13_03020 [Planctomycetia bacterium TMED53]